MGGKTVVLVAGNAGHGKTTLARFLNELVPDSRVDSYAASVKIVAKEALGIPYSLSSANNHTRATVDYYSRSIRRCLQDIGTLFRDNFDENIWCHRLHERIITAKESITFVDDCRFLNEINVIRELMGDNKVLTVRVRNPRVLVDTTHISEREMYELGDENFDFVIQNDDTLESYRAVATSYARLWGFISAY